MLGVAKHLPHLAEIEKSRSFAEFVLTLKQIPHSARNDREWLTPRFGPLRQAKVYRGKTFVGESHVERGMVARFPVVYESVRDGSRSEFFGNLLLIPDGDSGD